MKLYRYIFTLLLSFTVIMPLSSTEDFDDFNWDEIEESIKEVPLSFSEKTWLAFQVMKFKVQELGDEAAKHIEENKRLYDDLVHVGLLAAVALGGYYYLSTEEVEALVGQYQNKIKKEAEHSESEPNSGASDEAKH